MNTTPPASAASIRRIVQPYLMFNGQCDAALAYYAQVLGARTTLLMRFRDNPEPNECMTHIPGDKVMHASLVIGESEFFASDGMCTGQPKFEGISLSLSHPTADAAESTFKALAADGQVVMPFSRTFFSPAFGMVTDKFGLTWMIIVPAQP